MHDVLRQRLLRRIESLPEAQVYQVLDYIEFLDTKYGSDLEPETGRLQRLAEGLEDKLRKKAMSPSTLREAFQVIAAADRVLHNVSSAGKQIFTELGSMADPPPPIDDVGGEAARARNGRDTPESPETLEGRGDGREPTSGDPRP